MAAFDFDAAVRWARFDPRKTFVRRPDDELPFVRADQIGGQAFLLDTCVYVHQMQGKTPEILDVLIEGRQVNHSTVAIQELMHTVGALDPRHPQTPNVTDQIRGYVDAMQPHRVYTPDSDVLGKAALVSGILCRLQGYSADNKLRALLDCTLFLQSRKLGFTLLTGNVSDFDFLLQLVPRGRVLFYRS